MEEFRMSKFVFSFLAVLSLALPGFAKADDRRPVYEMHGMYTDIWDQDVDYFSPPIALKRTASTQIVHYINFNTAHYEHYCAQWRQQCVQYDSQGRCVRWEQVCAYWDYRIERVPRRISLDMRKANPLGKDDQELYELDIRRMKPSGDGDDSVSTWLRDESVVKPVVIRRWSDYQYGIETKP